MSEEMLTAVGKYESIEEKQSGWFEVKVGVGRQYPLRLSTKRSTLLDAVRETKGEVATFSYKESESERLNENTGKPYINRYLESVELGGSSNGTATASGNSQQRDVDWDEKDRRDFRSRAWAQTLSTFEHTVRPDEDPAAVFARLQPFQKLVYEDVVRGLAQGAPKEQQQTTIVDEPAPVPDDDDIPFAWVDFYEFEPWNVREHTRTADYRPSR